MASSSSSLNDNVDYDVFLSFRGETRNNFTSHLYSALDKANIKVFIDKSLDKGEELKPALLRVINGAKLSVVVFSSDYASSSFCLDELVRILERKESKGQIVLPIFYKVNPSDLRKLKGIYKEAAAIYESKFNGKKCGEKTSKEEVEKVQKWKSALHQVASLTGWHVDNTSDEAEVIEGITREVLKKLNCKTTCVWKGELISIPLVGKFTAVANLEKIWKCIVDGKISRVGVCGMCGVGKTTIITHIYNRVGRNGNLFGRTYWVTVSKESSIYKLQHDIAKVINLDLSQEDDKMKRAAMIWQKLKKKKFVLFLDDIWESFETEEVGIPVSVDEGKLLLTTRINGVCKTMKCEQIVQIKPLSKPEAWELFIKESGHQTRKNPELRKIVEAVVDECVGLPLAVVTTARSTRKFKEMYQWNNMLQNLRRPSNGQNHEMEKVFKLLKVSYDLLPNDKYRQCLVYCALYPEDCNIVKEDLIEFWICEGLIDELENRKEEFDMGNSMINELIDASLLESSKIDQTLMVSMHDVVRDMALKIKGENFLVKAGLQLKYFPKFIDWSVDLERISIMKNKTLRKCHFSSAPNCSKLKTLLMQNNYGLVELPGCFFDCMLSLTVLDMSNLYNLRLLPSSINKLKNLRLLNLVWCTLLEHIPSLAELENLWHLDLSMTNLKELPDGMDKLVKLKVLNLSNVFQLYGSIPNEVLEKLPLLQSLKLGGKNLEVEPDALISLDFLEVLHVEFKSFDALNLYLKSRHWQRLESYLISNKEEALGTEYPKHDKALFCCKDCDSAVRKGERSDVVIPFNVEHLMLVNWDSTLDDAFMNEGFDHLKVLTLRRCKFNYVISVAFAQQLLRNLEYLDVADCEYAEEIIRTEEEEEEPLNQRNHPNYHTINLPKLRSMRLKNLPRLKSIHRGMIELPRFGVLEIMECDKLERLPFSEMP